LRYLSKSIIVKYHHCKKDLQGQRVVCVEITYTNTIGAASMMSLFLKKQKLFLLVGIICYDKDFLMFFNFTCFEIKI